MVMEAQIQNQTNDGRKLTFGRNGFSQFPNLPPLPYLTRLPGGNLEEDINPTLHHVSFHFI